MTTDLQTIDKEIADQKISQWVTTDKARRQITAAVNDMIPTDMFISHMLVALEDGKIRRCTNGSKARVFMECAAMGLLPTANQVALIARKVKGFDVKEVTAMPQWQGYKALMERHPDILEVVGVLVHITDELAIEEGTLRHCYDPFDEGREFRNFRDVRGGYCKIVYRDGRPPKYHFVRRKTIEQAKGCAQTTDIWDQWFYEMALKTLYRNAFARRAVPVDPVIAARLERTLNADDVVLGNDPARITREAAQEHLEQARRLRQLADQRPPVAGPPEPEQSAAEDSQVDPAVDETEGVDEPGPEQNPEAESDIEEAGLAEKIKRVRTAGLESLEEIVTNNPLLTEAAIRRLLSQLNAREDYLTKGKVKQGEMFDRASTATEAGQ